MTRRPARGRTYLSLTFVTVLTLSSAFGLLQVRAAPAPSARDPSSSASGTVLSVGPLPEALAYDPAKGEVFVATLDAYSVLVVSDTTDSLVANVTVGHYPSGLAYDPAKGEVLVVSEGSGTVSAISDSNNSVVATVRFASTETFLGGAGQYGSFGAEGIVYDPSKGELFVANEYSDSVSVISDSSDAVVANVSVGALPLGLAYDPANGEVFVANMLAGGSVSVISDSTNTVIAAVSGVGYPNALAYDTSKGEVFVTDPEGGNVYVISGATNAVVASIKVGSFPFGITYDSSAREMFVVNQASSSLSVISDSTNSVVATVKVRSQPVGVVYDPAKGEIFVSSEPSYVGYPPSGSISAISYSSIPIRGTLWLRIVGLATLAAVATAGYYVWARRRKSHHP